MEAFFIIFCIALLFYIFNIEEKPTPKYCDMCSAPFSGKYHSLSADDKIIHICSHCKNQLDNAQFTEGRDLSLIPDIPPVPRGISTERRTGQSVTRFLKTIKQPRGGFISRKEMDKVEFDDANILSENENIHSILIGLAVDYLTRYMMFGDKALSFDISLRGASLVGERQKAEVLLEKIDDLDSETVISSLKPSGYDVAYRAGISQFKGIDNINPNSETINNIIIMVKRSVIFFKKQNLIDSGMTFEGGYTKKVSSGDADYLTEDTLWDMKVSKTEPNKDHTIQLIIYYILMKQSIKSQDYLIEKIGIFNPKKNISYVYDLRYLDPEVSKNIKMLINE